jgi:hypothetical protein
MKFSWNSPRAKILLDERTNAYWLVTFIHIEVKCYVLIFFYQTEMRFYVPNSNADDDEDDGSRKTVEVLHSEIMKHVVIEATGAQVRHG